MRVHLVMEDFGRSYLLYFVSEGPGFERIIRPSAVTNEGEIVWTELQVEEGTVMPVSLRFTRSMIDALRDALNEGYKPPADEELVRRLHLEEGRVDKMLTYLMEGH